jgi:DNA-binding beta-propeller fold protein YncE
LFVADGYGNHRVIVFDADTGAFKRMWGAFGKRPGGEDSCAIVSPKTFPDAEGPANFNVAHAIRVANDGMVYLADRENRRVQMFTKDGKFVKQLIRTGTTFARNLALSADAGQQFLYVGADKGITVVDRKTLDVVGTIQPSGILGPGHHIATDSKGNIYLAQTTAGMQKLVFKGMPPTQ